jgi:hypothetical protein
MAEAPPPAGGLYEIAQRLQAMGGGHAPQHIEPPPPAVHHDARVQAALQHINTRQSAAGRQLERARAGRGGEHSIAYQTALRELHRAHDPRSYR